MNRIPEIIPFHEQIPPFSRTPYIGREDSAFSIEEFTELKWITLRYVDGGFPPM